MTKNQPHLAYEMQKFTKPLSKRFFFAMSKWAALVLAIAAAVALAVQR